MTTEAETIASLPAIDTEVAGICMFNPTDPRTAYAEMHERCPMARTPSGGVAIFRMDDLLEVNRHPGIAGAGGATSPRGTLGAERPLIPLDIDGDDHKKYRRLLDPLFAPKRVATWEPIARARTNELIDTFIERGRAELYEELCQPLPSSIFVDMMGVPRDDMATFLAFKDAVVRPQGDTMEELAASMRVAGTRTYEYFGALLDARDASGEVKEDLIGLLRSAEVDGERLTRLQLLDITYLLMIAGLDTVASSLSCVLAWLARHPAERRWILEDPARWPDAIEELIRYESPVMYGSRTALEDVTVNERPFPAGTTFHVSWSAASLDPEAFEYPATVRLDRSPNRHAGFATGRHRCLGSHLARTELRIAMEELHRRIPEYRIDPDDELQYTAVGVRGASRLPIVFP
jgi:cytochrome P450